jgi:hypothetical protein
MVTFVKETSIFKMTSVFSIFNHSHLLYSYTYRKMKQEQHSCDTRIQLQLFRSDQNLHIYHQKTPHPIVNLKKQRGDCGGQ